MTSNSSIKPIRGTRKSAKVQRVRVISELSNDSSSALVFLNKKPIEKYFCKNLDNNALLKILKLLEAGVYYVQIKGGGTSAQMALLQKVLYHLINQENKSLIKKEYELIDRTDPRKVYPKRYGGPKARARIGKSYR